MSLDPCRSWRGWRRRKRAPERLALAPTRRSCAVHCKEQSQNKGIGPAVVFYSPRLVRLEASKPCEIFGFVPLKGHGLVLGSGFERSTPCACACAAKSPTAASRPGRLAQFW